MRGLIRFSCLVFAVCLSLAAAEEVFSWVSRDYVPKGKGYRQKSVATLEQCQASCAGDVQCKAFAFQSSRRACYFYPVVYQGGDKRSRAMGIMSAGLSIIPRAGFVSAFKRSSFPVFVRTTRLKGTVTDESRGAISGATIILHWDPAGSTVALKTNVGVKEDLVLKSDEHGGFVANVPSGFYDLFVSAMAFTPTCRKIRINGTSSFDVALRLKVDPQVEKELADKIVAVPPDR